MQNFFYYTFLNNKLIGSEDPAVSGNSLDKAKELCRHYDIKQMITLTQDYNEFKINGLTRQFELQALFCLQEKGSFLHNLISAFGK